MGLLIQFYRRENITRVFAGRNGKMLFEERNSVRRTVPDILGINIKSKQWTDTSWGSEVELELTIKE